MDSQDNLIRNFCIIAHIDHGKSTLADRLLEITGTVDKTKMQPQLLDMHPLERERGITIKMQPVRMEYHTRGLTQTTTQTNAENTLLYEDITYKIRSAVFTVKKILGLGHKENIYHEALKIEFKKLDLSFESEKIIDIEYEGQKIGKYIPDFIINDKVLIELKALPEIGKPQEQQIWSYLKGCRYRLALLINFGGQDVTFRRIIYDSARTSLRESASSQLESAQVECYTLNLIDTPGHADFGYEVSRALKAVEGGILLVDATHGIQAQTIFNYEKAIAAGLKIIPIINKIDLPTANVDEVKLEIVDLMKLDDIGEILAVSAKNGTGVEEILKVVIEKIPAPQVNKSLPLKALIFDSIYDSYLGVIAFVKIIDGTVRAGEMIKLMQKNTTTQIKEVGIFNPRFKTVDQLSSGEIGYIATGLKDITQARVGETITTLKNPTLKKLDGYDEPKPVIFASFYSSKKSDFNILSESIKKLNLNDPAFQVEEERSVILGRGYRCGFLGILHLDIIRERLKQEFKVEPVILSPSVNYTIILTDKSEKLIYTAEELPDLSRVKEIHEPWISMQIISPFSYSSKIIDLAENSRGIFKIEEKMSEDKVLLKFEIPLDELLNNFYDRLKSLTQGYASLNYEIIDSRVGDLVKLEILIAGEKYEPLSKIIPEVRAYGYAINTLKKLKENLPTQLFSVSLQAKIGGQIIAREDIKANKKDVTAKLYGGDITRKMKLREKQKQGKKLLKERGRIEVPPDVLFKLF